MLSEGQDFVSLVAAVNNFNVQPVVDIRLSWTLVLDPVFFLSLLFKLVL